MSARAMIDSRIYNGNFYGILNANGAFWTPLAFDSEAKAWEHLRDFWRASDREWQGRRSRFSVVPVRIKLEEIPASATGGRSPETNEDSAQPGGRQSGGEAATPTPNPSQGPNPHA